MQVNEERLAETFSMFGEVQDVVIRDHTVRDVNNGLKWVSGYGVVFYANEASAAHAVEQMDNNSHASIHFTCTFRGRVSQSQQLDQQGILGDGSSDPTDPGMPHTSLLQRRWTAYAEQLPPHLRDAVKQSILSSNSSRNATTFSFFQDNGGRPGPPGRKLPNQGPFDAMAASQYPRAHDRGAADVRYDPALYHTESVFSRGALSRAAPLGSLPSSSFDESGHLKYGGNFAYPSISPRSIPQRDAVLPSRSRGSPRPHDPKYAHLPPYLDDHRQGSLPSSYPALPMRAPLDRGGSSLHAPMPYSDSSYPYNMSMSTQSVHPSFERPYASPEWQPPTPYASHAANIDNSSSAAARAELEHMSMGRRGGSHPGEYAFDSFQPPYRREFEHDRKRNNDPRFLTVMEGLAGGTMPDKLDSSSMIPYQTIPSTSQYSFPSADQLNAYPRK